ncbi:MAG: hypothetical protein R2880_01620 [Deinococcales bacterium]
MSSCNTLAPSSPDDSNNVPDANALLQLTIAATGNGAIVETTNPYLPWIEVEQGFVSREATFALKMQDGVLKQDEPEWTEAVSYIVELSFESSQLNLNSELEADILLPLDVYKSLPEDAEVFVQFNIKLGNGIEENLFRLVQLDKGQILQLPLSLIQQLSEEHSYTGEVKIAFQAFVESEASQL